jgi:hypothetical protein
VTELALGSLDVLPPKCELETQFDFEGMRVRFRAVPKDGPPCEWTGWFAYQGEPIALHWEALMDL